MKRSLLSLPLALVALAAGCGGSGGDPDADPAAIVPARAPLYLEATLNTDEDFEAVAKKLSGADEPSREIKRLFDRAVSESGSDFRWDRDFEPWIGDRLGLYVTALNAQGEDADAAFVAPAEDEDKAEEFLGKAIRERDEGEPAPRVAERTHKDVQYEVDTANDEASAVLEGYAVMGTEQAVKSAIDAQKGESLADADAFERARDQVEDEALGFGYVRLTELFGSLGPQGAALRQVFGQTGDTVAFSLDADEDEIKAESAVLGVKGEAGPTGPGEVVESLPGDAWLAAGAADLGAALERQLEQFSQLGAFGGVNVDQILSQFRSQTGVDLRSDLLAWLGDAGVFVSGTGLSDIGGAVVVQSKDAAKSEAFVGDLQRLIARLGEGELRARPLRPSGGVDFDRGLELRAEGMPLPISVVSAGERFVVAVGNGALEAALKPAESLGDSAAYKEAAGKLGDGVKPQLFVNLEPVRGLLRDTGALQQAGPDGERVGRALEQLTTIVAGGRREGDVQRGELVVGVK